MPKLLERLLRAATWFMVAVAAYAAQSARARLGEPDRRPRRANLSDHVAIHLSHSFPPGCQPIGLSAGSACLPSISTVWSCPLKNIPRISCLATPGRPESPGEPLRGNGRPRVFPVVMFAIFN